MSPCGTYMMEMLTLINIYANIYKLHCPRNAPDQQASAPGGGKMNNVQGKNSCIHCLLALSQSASVEDSRLLQLDQLRGLYTYPKSSCIKG